MELVKLQEWIKNNLLNSKNNLVPKKVSYNAKWIEQNPTIYNAIMETTNFLEDRCPFSQRIYHILNNIMHKPLCVHCNQNYVKFKSYSKGYSEYCSQKCVNTMRIQKFKEKNGGKTPLELEKYKNKSAETKYKKYGNSGYNNTEKREKTLLDNYGHKNPLQIDKIKEKTIQTNMLKYGSKSPLLNKNVRNKTIKTLEEKYGKGVTNPFESNEVQEKIKKDRKERTGFEYNSQIYITNIQDLNKEFIELNFITDDSCFDLEGFQKYFNISYSHSYKKLKELGVYYNKSISTGESSLRDFIDSLTGNVFYNRKDIIYPKEVDVYIPSVSLAIEYNGCYWHCDTHERIYPNYHLDKTIGCENKNIQLLHIFENQWDDLTKRDIWKSIITNKLGKSRKLYGRKCNVYEINNTVKNDFLNENHLQGTCNSNKNFGLYYNNELVSVMSFGKPRFNKNFDWELLRFSNKKYTTVIGGASKLFNYFINNYKGTVITYADRTYSNGDLYKKMGFAYYTQVEVLLNLHQKRKFLSLMLTGHYVMSLILG